jgi:PAS domain S-box-containing protein/diguanylate cyclase (GGDEF)-like protein
MVSEQTASSIVSIESVERPWNLLFVEDDQNDVELCLRVLRKAQPNARIDVVNTPAAFLDRLRGTSYDVVISDYNLGTWNALNALTLLREEGHSTPLILVTGALGEVRAVECIKSGIADYVLKDRLERLPIAIVKAIEEYRLREEQLHAATLLREREEKFRALAEAIPAATFVEQGTRCCYVNRAAEHITGYSETELLGMNFWSLVHPESRKVVIAQATKYLEGDQSLSRYKIKILTKRSEVRWLDVTVGNFQLDGGLAAIITAFDVTQDKSTIEDIRHMVTTDPATGLANYHGLADVFDMECKRSERAGRSFSLLVFELEGLSEINSEEGCEAGDEAVSRFARYLMQCRASDTPGRLSEDKFAIILPETTMDGALTLARRIALRVREDEEQPSLTCSFGVGVHSRDGETLEQLLEVAERRSRATKVGGSQMLRLAAVCH